MQMKCLIVDDEQLARKLIKGYVDQVPFLDCIGSCKNPMEALQVLQAQQVDLLFLDIQMPGLLGTDLLKSLPNPPLVIFITAYKDFALEGYALDVVDYLLKPLRFDRFLQGVNKASQRFQLQQAARTSPATAQGEVSSPAPPSYLTLKADHKTYKVHFKDILYIESDREYVRYHTPQRKIMVLESLKKLETTLPRDQFMRIHKSYIINKSKVEALSGNQVEIAGQMIPIGKTYKDVVLKEIF